MLDTVPPNHTTPPDRSPLPNSWEQAIIPAVMLDTVPPNHPTPPLPRVGAPSATARGGTANRSCAMPRLPRCVPTFEVGFVIEAV